MVEFYRSEEVSRITPGDRSCITVERNGENISVQKHLMLNNLRELNRLFRDRYPDKKIGFSKFAELHPKEYILAGPSGTYTVCVCTCRQNVKLMMMGANISNLVKKGAVNFPTYQHCLAQIVCNPSQPQCHLEACSNCSGVNVIETSLQEAFANNFINDVTHKQWISFDRTSLETLTKKSEDFIDNFCDQLSKLVAHDFIAKQQSSYWQKIKDSLKVGEFLVVCDFAENYAFVVQDSTQGFHWGNNQATIHPIVV